MTFAGGACVLLAVGVAAWVAAALEAVAAVAWLDAAGCDELQAATNATSVKVAAAGMTRLRTASLGAGHETRGGTLHARCCGAAGALHSTDLNSADLTNQAGLGLLIMIVPAILFPDSCRPTWPGLLAGPAWAATITLTSRRALPGENSVTGLTSRPLPGQPVRVMCRQRRTAAAAGSDDHEVRPVPAAGRRTVAGPHCLLFVNLCPAGFGNCDPLG
jgi:hypothetical protein